jgi:hopanoid biosynthesis associated protein HpnK
VKRLITTADDFGLCDAVNEAVERAHRDGILMGASLMVGGRAAADAVARARRLGSLRVGLHAVVSTDRPMLPPAQVSRLVGRDGRLSSRLLASSVRLWLDPVARRQLAAELRAQFEAFAATGLPLDHVTVHQHLQLHPTVLGLLLAIGRDYGLRAMRVPDDPTAAGATPLRPWVRLLRARLQRHGIRANDLTLGLAHSGAMDEATVLRLLAQVPADRVAEMYFHPAAWRAPELDRTMPAYRHQDELAALVSPRVRTALSSHGITPTTFGAL